MVLAALPGAPTLGVTCTTRLKVAALIVLSTATVCKL